MSRITGEKLGTEICEALGIPPGEVCQIVINLKAGDVATIAFKRFLTDEESRKIGRTFWDRYKIESR